MASQSLRTTAPFEDEGDTFVPHAELERILSMGDVCTQLSTIEELASEAATPTEPLSPFAAAGAATDEADLHDIIEAQSLLCGGGAAADEAALPQTWRCAAALLDTPREPADLPTSELRAHCGCTREVIRACAAPPPRAAPLRRLRGHAAACRARKGHSWDRTLERARRKRLKRLRARCKPLSALDVVTIVLTAPYPVKELRKARLRSQVRANSGLLPYCVYGLPGEDAS